MNAKGQPDHSDTVHYFERYALAGGAQVSVVRDEKAATVALAASITGTVRCTSLVRDRYPGLLSALADAGHQVTVAEDIAMLPGEVRPPQQQSNSAIRNSQWPQTAPIRSLEQDPAHLAAALTGGTGVLLAHAGIAETGSVVLADDALPPRLLSMLCDVCVVLLPASAILPALDDAADLLRDLERSGHRYVSLVTGPSRTADIERVLTIGVQGPKALHIIVITNGEGA